MNPASRHNHEFAKALIVAAFCSLAGATYAADKIVLGCAGVSFNSDTGQRTPTEPKAIVIDLDHGLITLDLGSLPIIQVTENEISFEDRTWRGQIDRVSWTGFLAPRSHVPGNVRVELACKQAKPFY